MVKSFVHISAVCLCLFSFTNTASADLVINEVLSNEPGDSTTLEWIELYNDSEGDEYLAFYWLNINGDTVFLPSSGIGPFGYVVFCEKFFTTGTTPGFEAVWGNNSGVWGDDTTLENYPVFAIGSFTLPDDSGTVSLYFGTKPLGPSFRWSDAGPDGVSWERITPSDMVVMSSIDPKGSTPGEINSITPRQFDLAILPVEVWPEPPGLSGFEIKLTNVGLQPMEAGYLSVFYDLDKDSVADSADLIALIDFPETEPSDTVIITDYLELRGVYPDILIELPSDERLLNNMQVFKAFGKDYPPIIISEFIADPQDKLSVEWVELKNRSELDVDLNGWYLGDAIKLHPITSSGYILTGGEYVVLCKDSFAVASFYNGNDFSILQMSSWAILNNDGDLVRLRDTLGLVVDSFRYDFTYGGNYSWGRGEEPGKTDRWGRSISSGGTPGRENEIYFQASAASITVSVDPNPFSILMDEQMAIEFAVPPGGDIALKIYDVKGRLVRTLLDGVPAFDGRVMWDGRSDNGRRMNVGIYILHLEVSGVEHYKQTVVIAP